ncbi:MAG: hypothetical protein WDM76_04040 [Limisphaerales bacterium]
MSAFAFSASAQIIGQDSFESPNFSPVWSRTRDVAIQNLGGANATPGFASLNSDGSQLESTLTVPGKATQGLADFSIEFYFRTRNATNDQFSLRIAGSDAAASAHNAPFNLCYDARKGWGISSNTNDQTAWQSLAGMKPVTPDVWYRLRFVGRDWGKTNARYHLQLSDPNGNDFTASATNILAFENPNSTIQPAKKVILANTGNASFDVDEVSLVAITPYKGPVVKEVNTTTLLGKVMCGYQGWFGTPGDGRSEQSWRHWTKHHGPLVDGNAKVDLWPDIFRTGQRPALSHGFKMADGTPAEVFSSFEKPTVLKHFPMDAGLRHRRSFCAAFCERPAQPGEPGALQHGLGQLPRRRESSRARVCRHV